MLKFPQKSPQAPGVYFFQDKKGAYLYIGKASNLRSRLRSYFSKTTKDPRIEVMLKTSSKVEWLELGSEIEALLTEAEMIKRLRPKYNVTLRDGKNYAFVGVTKESYPRVFITHQKQQTIKSSRGTVKVQYFGPYTNGTAIKSTIKYLRRVFPYCTCKQLHFRYCLNYQIGKCHGYCCLKQDKDNWALSKVYRRNIAKIKALLNGKRTLVAKELEQRMKNAAKKGLFEDAITYREQLDKLKRIFDNAHVLRDIAGRDQALQTLHKIFRLPSTPSRMEGYDISNIHGRYATGSMVVFINGEPQTSQYRKFRIKIVDKSNDVAMLREILTRRFNRSDWPKPDLILIDGGKGQHNVAVDVLKYLGIFGVSVLSIAKGKLEIFSSTLLTPVALSNMPSSAADLLKHVDAEAHRFAISYYRKVHAKESLSRA